MMIPRRLVDGKFIPAREELHCSLFQKSHTAYLRSRMILEVRAQIQALGMKQDER